MPRVCIEKLTARKFKKLKYDTWILAGGAILTPNPQFSEKLDFLTGFLEFFQQINNFPSPLASSGSQKHQKNGAFVEICLPPDGHKILGKNRDFRI